jgi:hypothetical protein
LKPGTPWRLVSPIKQRRSPPTLNLISKLNRRFLCGAPVLRYRHLADH